MIWKTYSFFLTASLATINPLAYGNPVLLSSNTSFLALSVKNPDKNPTLTGKPRQFTIHNTSQQTAENVNYTLSKNFPADAAVSPASCGDIAPGGNCTLTVIPGKIPSAEPGKPNVPVNLMIKGNNTNSLLLKVNVLDYGSMYQQGWVFSIDDMTPASMSIVGKVAALEDAPNSPTIWSEDNIVVSGIDETSSEKVPSPPNPPGVIGCDGNLNGACDSQHIVAQDPQNVAAKTCTNYSIDENGHSPCQSGTVCYQDWYLPAICEMGYDTFGIGSGCGTLATPKLQNMELNLVYSNIPNVNLSNGTYWSATGVSAGDHQDYVWFQMFSDSILFNQQLYESKNLSFFIRCVRAFK